MKRPSLKMLQLLEKMVRDPFGWGRVLNSQKDGRKRQGIVRTLWALERHQLARFVGQGEPFVVDGVLHTAESGGWVASVRGRKIIQERDGVSPEIAPGHANLKERSMRRSSVEVTRGGRLRYENSPSLQRLLARLEKECGLVLPVDRVNYSLYLDRAAQNGTGWAVMGAWGWTASVHEMPQYGTLGSEQTVTRLLRCKVLEIENRAPRMQPFRIEVLGGSRK